MKTLAFIHSNDSSTAVGDFSPVTSVFSHYELGNSVSPFLLLDHLGPGVLKPTHLRKGVAEHPHRGFETVTIVYQGELEHRDSTGAGGVIASGDVQWMTAASGVLHEEVFSENFAKQGGTFEMIQLWVNLPAKDKMNEARYQSLSKEKIPEIQIYSDFHSQLQQQLQQQSYQKQSSIRVIAGHYAEFTGPSLTHSPMIVLDVKLKVGERIKLPAAEGDTTLIYLRSGRLAFTDLTQCLEVTNENPHILEAQNMAVMSSHGCDVELTAVQDSAFLYLSGTPLNEPIYGRGYFVMNTFQEVMQAYDDLKNKQFIRTTTTNGK